MALSPSELGSAEITSDATRAATSYADVAGLSVTVTVGTRPIVIEFDCPNAYNSNANGGVGVAILEDGVVIATASTLINSANAAVPLARSVRRAPSAGSHTYKIQLKTGFSGTATLKADSGTSLGPTSLHVLQV
jgi:hypothetical protein